METIMKEIACVWRIKYAKHYLFTKDGRCFNSKTGKELTQSYNSRCIGFYIQSKFYSLTKLINELEKIPEKEYTPF